MPDNSVYAAVVCHQKNCMSSAVCYPYLQGMCCQCSSGKLTPLTEGEVLTLCLLLINQACVLIVNVSVGKIQGLYRERMGKSRGEQDDEIKTN